MIQFRPFLTVEVSPLLHLLRAIWRFRGFIRGAVWREFHSRYVRSAFGFLWAVAEPLAMILIYTLVFSKVMNARLPGLGDGWSYSIYLCAGILTWGLFADTISRCQVMFLENANLLKKIHFPRITLPIISVVSASINFGISILILGVFLFLIDRSPEISVLFWIPLLLLQQMFAVGLGVFTGILNVFLRDTGKTMGVLLTFWFWATPIVYPIEILPSELRELVLTYNPMAPLMAFYQSLILGTDPPEPASLLPLLGCTFVFLIAGYLAFTRLSDDLVDEL